MDIRARIEHIRQQPESIRIRYVWMCVSCTMFFVIIIWILSLQNTFKDSRPLPASTPQTSPTEQNTSKTPSLEEVLKNNAQTIENTKNTPSQSELPSATPPTVPPRK